MMWLFCKLKTAQSFNNIPAVIEFVKFFVMKLHKFVFLVAEHALRLLFGG